MYCVCTYIVSVVRCQMYVVHSCQTCCKKDGIKNLNRELKNQDEVHDYDVC